MRLFVFSVYRVRAGFVYPLKYQYIFIDLFYMFILSIKTRLFSIQKKQFKKYFYMVFLGTGWKLCAKYLFCEMLKSVKKCLCCTICKRYNNYIKTLVFVACGVFVYFFLKIKKY